jgi:hypothetical protein
MPDDLWIPAKVFQELLIDFGPGRSLLNHCDASFGYGNDARVSGWYDDSLPMAPISGKTHIPAT